MLWFWFLLHWFIGFELIVEKEQNFLDFHKLIFEIAVYYHKRKDVAAVNQDHENV